MATILVAGAMASAIFGGTVQARHGQLEPGDDRGGHGQPVPSFDDHGGLARHGQPEPGDDRGGHGGDDGANHA
jgi:hypothetical protein